MTVRTDTTIDRDTATVSGRFSASLPQVRLDDVKKPVFAYVGVADLVLAQAKELPAELSQVSKRVSARLAEVPSAVRTLPARVEELRGEVENRVSRAGEQAGVFYAALAVRGERLVTQLRRQPATEAAIAEGREAVRKAEAAAIAARNSARAGGRAVEGAAATIG